MSTEYDDDRSCEFCGKPIATYEDGEMQVDDPRIASFCWARPEDGDTCPVEQARLDRMYSDRDPPEDDGFDPMGCPGCGGNCARACR